LRLGHGRLGHEALSYGVRRVTARRVVWLVQTRRQGDWCVRPRNMTWREEFGSNRSTPSAEILRLENTQTERSRQKEDSTQDVATVMEQVHSAENLARQRQRGTNNDKERLIDFVRWTLSMFMIDLRFT
jgi:hypothetical protein